jgi:hypothetical protein
VLVDGQVVVRGGRLVRVDEESLLSQVEPISKEMYRLFGRIRRRPLGVKPTVEKLYRKAGKLSM